jgi:hypothetical protein
MMRILIDECIDERFRNYLPGHDCQTARYAGLAGLSNGELLTAAETARFDVFLTADQGIRISAKFNWAKYRNHHLPGEIEPLKRPLAVRARLPRADRIHSTGPDRENRGLEG